jgi:hypothetical protein
LTTDVWFSKADGKELMEKSCAEDAFIGYHSEWNLGSPGGWYYQLMTQKLGRLIWERISRFTGMSLPLVFDHPMLDSPPRFRDMLFRAHEISHGRAKSPGIALLAEEETLETVMENRLMVEYLAGQSDTNAVLAAPHELVKTSRGKYSVGDTEITVVYCDFNNETIIELERQNRAGALYDAVSEGLTVNPRGMEPIGSKGIFEAVCTAPGKRLSASTVSRTPWTRRFYERSTQAPDGSVIADLVEWTRINWSGLVLKPEHGFSGKGVFVGLKMDDPDACIKTALEEGEYIVQQLIPPGIWAELYPELEPGEESTVLRSYQTDFRCLINDAGLLGFVCRYGGIPTNVGMGGGTQALALVEDSAGEAARSLLEAVEKMKCSDFEEMSEEVKQTAILYGLTYLKGPMPQAMRPRIISFKQLVALEKYAVNLWHDCAKLEQWWRRGELDEFLSLPGEDNDLARLQPWGGTPAVLASDGLYSFGADLMEK